jgi:hypothetical protein
MCQTGIATARRHAPADAGDGGELAGLYAVYFRAEHQAAGIAFR